MTFDAACSLVETALTGTFRQEIASDLARATDLRKALLRLRESMRCHVWKSGEKRLGLDTIVQKYDARTRQEGFHVLHDWDGKADQVLDDTIPIDVLHYLIDRRGSDSPEPAVLAILLDYYFMHLLALLSLRVWDEGEPDANLDRLNHLLAALQGPHGSGQRFADDAETLLLIATSHFELQEVGYDKLLAKVRTLNRAHRTNIALGHAASMGCHLRFGFEATYARDTLVMRSDNIADYPWLCFALMTLMREYARLHEEGIAGTGRDVIVEAMLNGLCADARAFVGDPPASLSSSLSSCEAERSEFRGIFLRHRQDLLQEFERYRPSEGTYSPISFFFNFSHNIVKGTVIDALLRGRAWPLTLNDLLTAMPRGEANDSSAKAQLAATLMEYARASPDRIRGRLMPVVVYDPQSGREAFGIAMRKLRE